MNTDPWLQLIISSSLKAADTFDGRAKQGITLSVGGILVSGFIISRRDFLLSDSHTSWMLEIADKSLKSGTTPSEDVDDEMPEFIHLSDVRFFVPGNSPAPSTGKGVFWRGRISEVSGFFLGTLSQNPT